MTLPVPRSLKPRQEKQETPSGSLSVQPVVFKQTKVGHMEFEHSFRPTKPVIWVMHVFMASGPFPLNFGQKLHRVIYGMWPGAKEVKVEWVQEFRSYCVRVYQQERPEGWGDEEVEQMIEQGFGK
jgi:hypothetical protein